MNLNKNESKTIAVEEELVETIVEAIQDVKGKNIVTLNLQHVDDSPADFFVVCEGDSTVQIRGISERVYKTVKDKLGLIPNHIEGVQQAKWVLVDYFNIVVHIFYPETRRYYQIEDLWSDAESTIYESL